MDLHQQIARLELRIESLITDLRKSDPQSDERAEIKKHLIPLFPKLVDLKTYRERLPARPPKLEIVEREMALN